MQRNTWVALGALALATPALAQNVVISGFLDIGVYRDFDKNRKLGTIQRSNIAFSGSEDLGGGLAATFKLSHRLDLNTGGIEGAGKPFWHGESTVGVKGGFGHVRLGRALDVVSNNDWAYDPWYNFNRIASPAWQYWHYNYASDRTSNSGGPEYGRLANGIFYDSPAFGGFTVHLSGSFTNTQVPGAGDGNNTGVSLNYNQGPVSLMLAGSRNSNDDNVAFFGAKYDFGAFALMAAYDRSTFDLPGADSTAKTLTLGATYGLGAVTLKAGYGRLDVDGAKSNFVGLGADYPLSKRTTLYASAGRNKPSGSSALSAYGVGVSHSF